MGSGCVNLGFRICIREIFNTKSIDDTEASWRWRQIRITQAARSQLPPRSPLNRDLVRRIRRRLRHRLRLDRHRRQKLFQLRRKEIRPIDIRTVQENFDHKGVQRVRPGAVLWHRVERQNMRQRGCLHRRLLVLLDFSKLNECRGTIRRHPWPCT